jgi:hypothetical protein
MAKASVSIESEERTLSGRLFTPQEPNGSAVVFVHGFGVRGRSCEQYAKRIVQNGITGLTFDLGGHGDSSGDVSELSVNDHLADLTRAYDYIAAQQGLGINPQRIGVAGMSYGGYLAALLSPDRAVKSLFLRSPPLYPESVRDAPRDAYTLNGVLYGEPDRASSALSALRGFAGRVVLVVSEHDEVVVPRITDIYKEAIQNGEQKVLEGVQHNLDKAAQELFRPLVVEWAESL